jgi:cytochrome P450
MSARPLPGPGFLETLSLTAELRKNPYETVRRMHERYGDVFAFGSGKFRFIYLIGPEANRFVLAEHPEKFRWREAFDILVPVSGETALIVSDGDAHKRRRRLIQPAFHKKRIDAYLETILEETDATLKGWSVGSVLDVYEALRATVRRIVIRTLFGETLAKHSEAIGFHLQRMLDFINKPPFFQFRVPIPGTGWSTLVESRKALDALIYEELRRRRQTPDEGGDVMALLLATRDETGDVLSDVEVRDQMASLITAGYDTTSAALGWAVYVFLTRPELLERARAEARAAPLTLEGLAQMPFIERFINEVLRLYPPASIAVRKSAEDFELQGHLIPAGSNIAYSAYVTHRLPSLWPQPDHFDPERWNADAPGHRPIGPYDYVPFGQGARRCIGAQFALLEMKAMLARLVGAVQLTLLSRDVRPTGIAAMIPAGGVRVRVDARR